MSKSKRHFGLRGIFMNILILLITLVLIFAIMEFGARFFTGLLEYNIIKTDIGLQHTPNKAGKLIYEDFKTYYNFNSLGFRDYEHNVTKMRYRVALLGDSFTEALSVNFNESFGNRLEKKLNIEVLNFGLGSTGTSQSYFLIKKYTLQYNPDEVIYTFYPNDVSDSYFYETNSAWRQFKLENGNLIEIQPLKSGLIKNLARKSFFVMYIYNMYKNAVTMFSLSEKNINIPIFFQVFEKKYTDDWKNAWILTEKVLVKMNTELKNRNIRFKIAVIPYRTQIYPKFVSDIDKYNMTYDLDKPDKMMKEICKRNNLSCIFTLSEFRKDYNMTGKVLYYEHDQHWTPEGHALFADILANSIKNGRR